MKFFKHTNMSLKSKLLLTFFLGILIPIILVQSVTYYNSTQSMQEKVDELVNINLQQTYKNLETSLKAYEDITVQLFSDEKINSLVKEMNIESTNNPIVEGELREVLSNYAYAKDLIRSVSIYTSNRNIVSFDKQTGSNIKNIWTIEENNKRLREFQLEASAGNGIRITSPELTDHINGRDQYLFHIYVPLQETNYSLKDRPNLIVISIDQEVLNQAININYPIIGTENSIPNLTFLVNDNKQIVSFPKDELIGYQLSSYENSIQLEHTYVDLLRRANIINSDSIIVNNYQKPINGWTLVNVIDKNTMLKNMYVTHRINIITGLITLLISSFLILYFTNNISKSIKKVINGMQIAKEGHLDVQINEMKKDEISIIMESFNSLMNKLNNLMTETKEATFKQKEAEIRALEAQINPHFLYNTLDSINWMAIEKEEHDISRMLKSLAEILRYSIQNSNELVTISEEINWLKKYMILQLNRYDYSFDYTIEVEKSLYNHPIHKLLLQPFIENAIAHGISSYQSEGLITLTFKKGEQNELIIIITDNGVGMTADKLASIKFAIKEDQSLSNRQRGIGLRNVMERLNSYYGEKANFQIESSPPRWNNDNYYYFHRLSRRNNTMKVVVIEDEIKIRTGLVKLIRKLKPNYELIVEAKDGVEGYSLIKQINPEIVFLDINMPKLNGLEMLKKLNDLEITRRTIILSGYSEFEYAQTAIRLGVKEYLLKPITIDDLTLTLDTIEKDILQQSLFGISYKESDKQNKQTLEKLINGTSSDLEEVGLYMNKILGFLLENNFTIINLYYGKHHERYYSEIKNLLSIIKKQSNDPFFFAILDNQYQWLIIQQDKIINTPDSRLLSKLKQLGEDIIISVITVPNFQEIKTAIMANECNRKWSITLKDEQVIVEDLIRNVQDSVETFVYPIGIERKANSAISSSTPWLASDFIIEFKDQITQTIFHPKEILDNCFRFFSAILHSAVLVHRGGFLRKKSTIIK
ncbi:two-component response regulator [Gracilibacillus boraciitolerans JCM 21714]|uniref:Two-component response regulator n=1 Tax=Gracilibacillus boraciitolerans JCM 21714 TaxID=1298598 RepID=W4VN17_9BACI|nr:histidine kinase [Gracilibacillus boraciitolerans]GAE94815.1 two-component response regulator [Gracilibacillus boraciitolerans JCM 21714]